MDKRELIILGMGSSRTLCLYDAEVWSCNVGYLQIAQANEENPELNAKLNKIFMSHPNAPRPDGKGLHYNFDQMNLMVKHGIEIFNIHRCKGLNSRMYPLKRISKKFNTDFFSNTICYMMAYAVDQATTRELKLRYPMKVRIYGVDMMTKDEYELEKGGIEYWIGYARGLGIEVELYGGGAVLQTCTGLPYGVKFYKIKDVDPWGLLKCGKMKKWQEQAGFSDKQMKKLAEHSDAELAEITDGTGMGTGYPLGTK
uniref:Uncharacterized protein n=1 Tax=viral metagenome TaxID=1070528 RepID=A0A6M3IJ94_9ZZZZ